MDSEIESAMASGSDAGEAGDRAMAVPEAQPQAPGQAVEDTQEAAAAAADDTALPQLADTPGTGEPDGLEPDFREP